MRLEITHTIKASNYTAFIRAYNEALAIDRKSYPGHKEPRVLVSVWGEINRVRIEFEFEISDTAAVNWLDAGCPSGIEQMADHHKGHIELAEKTEVNWVRDVDLSAV